MIISTATKSLRKRCNTDMKEKLACEIYELITCSCLPLIETSPLKPVHSNQQIGFYMIGISMMKDLKAITLTVINELSKFPRQLHRFSKYPFYELFSDNLN